MIISVFHEKTFYTLLFNNLFFLFVIKKIISRAGFLFFLLGNQYCSLLFCLVFVCPTRDTNENKWEWEHRNFILQNEKQKTCAPIRIVSLCSEHLAPDSGDRDSAGVCRGEKLLHRHPGVQSSLHDVITIYAPVIYTAPCIMFWMGAYTLRGEVGGGWALEFPSFLGPVKWERADRQVPFGAQKTDLNNFPRSIFVDNIARLKLIHFYKRMRARVHQPARVLLSLT